MTRELQVHAGITNKHDQEEPLIQTYDRFFWNATAEDAIEYLQKLDPEARVNVLEVPTIDDMMGWARP